MAVVEMNNAKCGYLLEAIHNTKKLEEIFFKIIEFFRKSLNAWLFFPLQNQYQQTYHRGL